MGPPTGRARLRADAWHAITAAVKDPETGADLPHYEYEPDERPKKRKHHWDNDWAGFVRRDGVLVAKCPVSLTLERAEALLNDGVPWFNPRAPGPHPDRVYVVHDGVVYRATPTHVGRAYHGFPEHPERLRELPKRVREMILQRAQHLQQEAEVLAWMAHEPEEE